VLPVLENPWPAIIECIFLSGAALSSIRMQGLTCSLNKRSILVHVSRVRNREGESSATVRAVIAPTVTRRSSKHFSRAERRTEGDTCAERGTEGDTCCGTGGVNSQFLSCAHAYLSEIELESASQERMLAGSSLVK
jgi:hypothetical protein